MNVEGGYGRVSSLAGCVLLAALVVSTGTQGCGSSECAGTACLGTSPDGSVSPDGGDVDPDQVSGVACDLAKEPKDSPGCVANSVGVFVDGAKGDDANDGKRSSPAKTIGGAIAKLGGRSRVYVCSGTYAESIQLTSAVSIYGGFDCAGWAYTGQKARVVPDNPGYALELVKSSGAVFSDLAFESRPGTTDKRSSVAVFANESAATFHRCELTAGNGHEGAGGTTASNYDTTITQNDPRMMGHARGAAGNSPGGGGPPQMCTGLCVDNQTSTGGHGGDGNYLGGPRDGYPGLPPLGAGAGGTVGGTCKGGDGASPVAGADGAAGSVLGAVTAQGWIPTDGPPGTGGSVGQGGGGGGGTATGPNHGGGGGGGCGGCGGAPGGRAEAGGGSIALLAFASVVTFDASTLTSGTGGDGGDGAAGQAGQLGGFGGIGESCYGGAGGQGSAGGASAGGASGVSAAVVKDPTTTLTQSADTSMTTHGNGERGKGGKPGVNDGPAAAESNVVTL